MKAKAGSLPTARELLDSAEAAGPVKIVAARFNDQEVDALRKLGDSIKETDRTVVVLFANNGAKGPVLLFMANKGAVDAGVDCGKLIKSASAVIGGGGGGRPDMAQAGLFDFFGLKSGAPAANRTMRAGVKAAARGRTAWQSIHST
ncbi:MAG: hypothetical protein HY042_01520 [Spirochaetia bacterium]|nr:hypothetical protein [Spirochaetia bacterium]